MQKCVHGNDTYPQERNMTRTLTSELKLDCVVLPETSGAVLKRRWQMMWN